MELVLNFWINCMFQFIVPFQLKAHIIKLYAKKILYLGCLVSSLFPVL